MTSTKSLIAAGLLGTASLFSFAQTPAAGKATVPAAAPMATSPTMQTPAAPMALKPTKKVRPVKKMKPAKTVKSTSAASPTK